jgi:hypothetical protein
MNADCFGQVQVRKHEPRRPVYLRKLSFLNHFSTCPRESLPVGTGVLS